MVPAGVTHMSIRSRAVWVAESLPLHAWLCKHVFSACRASVLQNAALLKRNRDMEYGFSAAAIRPLRT
jgi:hypothetical protein